MRRALILAWGLAAALAGGSRVASSVVITAPEPGTSPRSGYLALEGIGPPLSRIELLENGALLRSAVTAADGHFDCLLKLPPGKHDLEVRANGDPAPSSAIVRVTVRDGFAAPRPRADYLQLREGDVLFSQSANSEQVKIYNPVYTHTALYVGPDSDGTPMVLEAAVQPGNSVDGVLAIFPLEQTLVWREERAAVYRLRGGLKPSERLALLAWARATAAREPSFWSITDDFGTLFRAWLLWDRQHDRPLDASAFDRLLALIRAGTVATNRFNCATLVWRAFFDATKGRVDLSQPNHALEQPVPRVTRHFIETIRPVLLLPDTLALSGKLEQVG